MPSDHKPYWHVVTSCEQISKKWILKIFFSCSLFFVFFSLSAMVTKIKINSDVLRLFTGEGNVVACIKKMRFMTKLQGIKYVACLMPLYLEGSVLNHSIEMDEEKAENN